MAFSDFSISPDWTHNRNWRPFNTIGTMNGPAPPTTTINYSAVATRTAITTSVRSTSIRPQCCFPINFGSIMARFSKFFGMEAVIFFFAESIWSVKVFVRSNKARSVLLKMHPPHTEPTMDPQVESCRIYHYHWTCVLSARTRTSGTYQWMNFPTFDCGQKAADSFSLHPLIWGQVRHWLARLEGVGFWFPFQYSN